MNTSGPHGYLGSMASALERIAVLGKTTTNLQLRELCKWDEKLYLDSFPGTKNVQRGVNSSSRSQIWKKGHVSVRALSANHIALIKINGRLKYAAEKPKRDYNNNNNNCLVQ